MPPARSSHDGKVVINRMTSRVARRPAALDPGHVRLDERSLPELLDFAVRVAPLVHYYAPTNEREGDFRAFFLDDPAMVLASIVATPTAAMEATFTRLGEAAKGARGDGAKLDKLREIVSNIMDLARLVDRWLLHLHAARRGSASEGVLSAIESSIDGPLREALGRLRGYGAGAEALGRPILVPAHGLSPRWRAEPARDDSLYRGETIAQKIDAAVRAFADVLGVFLGEIERVQALARQRFSAVVAESHKKPHIALTIAFAQQLQAVAGASGGLSGRIADFYHRDVLREGPRGPVGDSAFLTFTLAPDKGVTSALVPAGSRFSAGKDADGRDIVFATDAALRVGAARLDQIRALSVIQGSLLPPSTHESTGSEPIDDVPLQALSTEISLGGGPFAPFGEPAPGAAGSSVTSLATLGFAVASPYLRLSGGERTVRVFLRVTEGSMAALRGKLDRIAAATGARSTDVLRSVFRKAFSLAVSTKEGFVAAGPHDVIADDGVLGDREIGLQVVLSPTFPAIAPLAPQGPEAPGAGAPPALPMLRADLQQERIDLDLSAPRALGISVLALSLLADLTIEALWLETDVRGLDDLTLASPAGPISTGQPFFPFGSAPRVGAYLSIHHPEIFEKRPLDVSVAIEWYNLPSGDDGFSGYYREYTIGVDGASQKGLLHNRSFQVGFEIAGRGAFDLGADAKGLYLFRTEDAAEPDAPDAAGKLAPETAFPPLPALPADRPDRYDPSKSALVMSLVAPEEGFGDSVYPRNTVAAVLRPAQGDARCEEACAAVHRPLSDAAKILASAVDLCGSKADDKDCRRCFSSSLGACRGMLTGAVMASLDKAAAEEAGRAKPEALAAIDGAEAAARGAAGGARKAAVERWLIACREAMGPFAIGGSGWVAERLWDALVCIDACEADAQGPDVKAKMVPCLTRCREALEKAHEEGSKACVEACTSTPKEPALPRVPWLPAAKRVSLGYTTTSFVTGTAPEGAAGAEQAGALFHILPFGDLAPSEGDGPVSLLPALNRGGALLLGFRALAPEPLTLLVHLDSTGDAGAEAWPRLVWECLSGDDWLPLPVIDGTGGLRRTGLVTLRVPVPVPIRGPERAISDLAWIRASTPAGERRFPRVIGVTPHAARATWRDEGNTGAHLEKPRPAGSIKAPLDKLPPIAKVTQPMASFGGRPPETPETMPVRLGERLRHKGRAVMGWDYERLALDAFPQIDRVTSLPARGERRDGGPAPGEVTVVVMPGEDASGNVSNLTPSFETDTLAEVAESLLARTSPFVKVHVRNPVYVEITVTARVELAAEADAEAIEASLVHALSPWFPDPPWAASGQGYPIEDDIAELLRARPDVVSVLDVRFDYAPDPADLDWYYLTSAPSHHILPEIAYGLATEGELHRHA